MQYFLGTDIIEIARIQETIDRWGPRFLNRVYTERELKLFRDSTEDLAVRFAGKEAVFKTLNPQHWFIPWKCVEIDSERSGKPFVNVYGIAKTRAAELGIDTYEISMSHSRDNAIAVAIGYKR